MQAKRVLFVTKIPLTISIGIPSSRGAFFFLIIDMTIHIRFVEQFIVLAERIDSTPGMPLPGFIFIWVDCCEVTVNQSFIPVINIGRPCVIWEIASCQLESVGDESALELVS